MIEPFEPCELRPDYHAVYSIQLCELINGGFEVFGDTRWASLDWYDAATRERLEEKLLAHYWYREIGITPAGEWRHEFTRVMGEILPKYKPVYKAIADGLSPLAERDEYGKERNVYSDFPATQLNTAVQDYAKSANDRQYERITNGDLIDKMNQLQTQYNDVDAAIIEEMEVCFSCLMTVSMNAL